MRTKCGSAYDTVELVAKKKECGYKINDKKVTIK